MIELENASAKAAREIAAQMDQYLKDQMDALGLSIEEFARLYTIEEYPFETHYLDDRMSETVTYRVSQKVRVRRKTDEELAAALPASTPSKD